jgi:hypothetical protein
MESLGIWYHGWAAWPKATVNLGASTISRVVDKGEEDPEFKSRPVGFTADLNIDKE